MPHASKRARPSCLIVSFCLSNDLVELAGTGVGLDLRIPSFPILIKHPITQLRELARCEFPNLLLNLFDFAHRANYTPDLSAGENV